MFQHLVPIFLTQAMHGGVNGGILDLQINYVYLHLKILMGQCILLACQHPWNLCMYVKYIFNWYFFILQLSFWWCAYFFEIDSHDVRFFLDFEIFLILKIRNDQSKIKLANKRGNQFTNIGRENQTRRIRQQKRDIKRGYKKIWFMKTIFEVRLVLWEARKIYIHIFMN